MVRAILVCYILDCDKIVYPVRLFAHAKLGSVALIHCLGYLGVLLSLLWLISGPSATVCSCKTGLSGTDYFVWVIYVLYLVYCG